MIVNRSIYIFLAILLLSCESETRSLEVSNIRVFAPITDSNSGVAYMTITNNGENSVTLKSVRSPQFDYAEIHENVLNDGIARMRHLDKVIIYGGDSAIFQAGGKHIMLIGAQPDTIVGSDVTLEMYYDDGRVSVTTTMINRLASE